MFTKLHIKNYKSVLDNEMELGRVNVLIGENGCGKSNLLEAVAFLSAAKEDKLDPDALYARGIRVADSEITFSSFADSEILEKEIKISINHSENGLIQSEIKRINQEKGESFWIDFDAETLIDIIYRKQMFGFSETNKWGHQSKNKRNKIGVKSKDKWASIFNKDYLDGIGISLGRSASLIPFVIYHANIKFLRGVVPNESLRLPVGINGDGLDKFINEMSAEEIAEISKYNFLIDWLSDFTTDNAIIETQKTLGKHKSNSSLYLKDRFMRKGSNVFSAENANEGVLFVLFYLGLFVSKRTPDFFAIDNIETSLNPHLCRELMRVICELAKKNNKQVLITTHNPAILDGLNIHDDEIRLFEVSRSDEGHTRTRRIKVKPEVDGKKHKLSELWMRGYLGAIAKNF